jgi:hypothetical protein
MRFLQRLNDLVCGLGVGGYEQGARTDELQGVDFVEAANLGSFGFHHDFLFPYLHAQACGVGEFMDAI